MDSYKEAVDAFYDLYFKHSKQYDWEHRVVLNGYSNENMIEIRDDFTTIIRVKDEDAENIWRRATDELQSWLNRHQIQ